jgi:hypothetical protein
MPPRKLLIESLEAVGGDGGMGARSYRFDSGCHWSGVRKIWIRLSFRDSSSDAQQVIKRVTFQFGSVEKYFPSSDGILYNPLTDTDIVLNIEERDPVGQIDVWTDGVLVTAIQFHSKSGTSSELYGMPTENCSCVYYEGKHPDSKLAGVHGSHREIMNKIGFTFATDASDDIDSDERNGTSGKGETTFTDASDDIDSDERNGTSGQGEMTFTDPFDDIDSDERNGTSGQGETTRT